MPVKRYGVFGFALLLALGTHAQRMDTVHVFFAHDEHTAINTVALDSLIAQLPRGHRVQVAGYTDFTGTEAYNLALSERRAAFVAQHIHAKSQGSVVVVKVTGRGALPEGGNDLLDTGIPRHRRVDVIFEAWSQPKEVKKPAPVSPPPARQTHPAPKAVFNPEPLPQAYHIDTVAKTNIVLEGLSFIEGRHYPLNGTLPVLERLTATMRQYPGLHIEIQGYICCEYNLPDGEDIDTKEMHLSRNRAKFVYDFLVREGIDPNRMSYKGYGGSKPKVFPEVTDEDRQANRRVEIKIVKMD